MTINNRNTVDVLIIRDYIKCITVQDRIDAIKKYNDKYGLLPGITIDARNIGNKDPQDFLNTLINMFTKPQFRVVSFDWKAMTATIDWLSTPFDLSNCYLCLCYIHSEYTIDHMVGCYLSLKDYNDNEITLTPRPKDHKINPNEVNN